VKTAVRISAIILILAGIGALAAFGWSRWPISVDQQSPDPAMAYANAAGDPAARFSEGYFEHDGLTLHFAEAGRGDAILFLHGFPSYWPSFINQMEALKADFRVIAIDGLGAGRSDAPLDPERYRLEAMSEHIMALLADLSVERVHLVGHDWGAGLAFGLAQRHPERFLSVTGIGAPPQTVLVEALSSDPATRKRAAYVERLKQASPVLIMATGGHDRVWQGAYEPLVRSGKMPAELGALFKAATGDPRRLNAQINWYRANLPEPDQISDRSFWPSRNAQLTIPAQIIWGDRDRVFSPAYVAMMRARSGALRELRYEGVGHWPHVERADAVTRAIRQLIETAKGN
jgi:pimeloyl-ACP methyl ester carboxylesterase